MAADRPRVPPGPDPAAAGFVLVSLLIPCITGYVPLVASHALLGLLLGCFVTATILITLKHLPPPWWITAFAFFTLRVSLATNTGVSLAALYTDFFGWQWIYRQGAVIMLAYLALLRFGLPDAAVRKDMLEDIGLAGMGFFCLGVTMLFVGMDQGERMGGFDSGFVSVCLFGGGILLAAFFSGTKPWFPSPGRRLRSLPPETFLSPYA